MYNLRIMGLETSILAAQRAELESALKAINGRKQLARAGLSFPAPGQVDAGKHWSRPYLSILDDGFALILGRTKQERTSSGIFIYKPDSPISRYEPGYNGDPPRLVTSPIFSSRTIREWEEGYRTAYTTLGIVVEIGTDTPLQGYAYYRLRSHLQAPPQPRLKINTGKHPAERTQRRLYPYKYEDTGGLLLRDIRSAASRFEPFPIDIEKPEASQRALEEQISYLIDNLFAPKN